MQKKLLRSLFTVAAIAAAAQAAVAQERPEGLHVRAIAGIEHDDNVLRVPSSAAGRVSDTVFQAGVGLSYNKQFSLQRLRADIEADTYRYSDTSSLNYTTVNYALAWDWSITPRFHGTLSADRRQYREVTSDPLFLTNIVGRRTERNEMAEGIFEVSGPFRVMAGAGHSRAESSQPRSWDASPDISWWQAGVGYEFASGSNMALRYRQGDGEYKDPTFATLNRGFKDKETEFALRWVLTGKTTFDGRIAHRQRDHDGAPALDFSGMVGNANVVWDVTGKTRVVAGYLRDLSATGLTTGGHVQSDRIFIAPKWQWTGKTAFTARWDHTRREWQDIAPAVFGFGRTETIESTQVGADWEALRWLTVSPYLRHERMKSSLSNGYRATVYGVSAKAMF